MRIKILAVLVLTAACFGVGYFVGFDRGGTATARDRDMYDLRVYSHLLRCYQLGDTNLVESGIRALAVTWCYHYDTHFGGEAVTDTNFLKDLTYARALVAQDPEMRDDSALADQVNRTNRVPNTALEPTPTAP